MVTPPLPPLLPPLRHLLLLPLQLLLLLLPLRLLLSLRPLRLLRLLLLPLPPNPETACSSARWRRRS